MINKVTLTMIAGLMLVLGSCGTGSKGTASVEGRIDGGAGMTLKLEELDPMGSVLLDSVTAGRDGTFRFDFTPKEAGFYILKVPGNRMTVLTAAPGDRLSITCNAATFPEDLKITGSEDAKLLGEFYAFSYRQQARSDSLKALIDQHRGDSLFVPLALKADTVFNSIWNEQRAYEMAFLEKHPSSFAALIVVNYSFGVRPVLSIEEDVKWYKRVDSALSMKFPGNPHVDYNRKRIAEFERQAELKSGAKP